MSIINLIVGAISGKGSGGAPPPAPGDNTMLALWTEDIARDWVRVEFENSITGSVPLLTAFSVNGSNPTEIVLRYDKVAYLKFAAPFSEGETISLSYTAAGGLLGNLGTQSGIAVENNITTAEVMTWTESNHFNSVDVDFAYNNKIIIVPAGTYGLFDIGRGENITIVCGEDGPAHFTYCNFREAVLNVTLVGHPARVQSLKIHEAYDVHFGIGCFATGNLRFEDLEIYDHLQGIQVKTVSDLDFSPYNLSRTNIQTLSIKRVKIRNVSQEALYIGADVSAPLIPIRWTVEDIELVDIGRDGVQVRNGSGTVSRVTATKASRAYAIGHALDGLNGHFLAYGETSTGCVFEDCSCYDGVYGNLVFINGYGPVTIRRVSGISNLNCVHINNYGTHDDLAVGGKTVTFEEANSFTTVTGEDPRSLDVRRDPAKTAITLNINPETVFVNPVYIEDGVHGGTDNGIVTNYT